MLRIWKSVIILLFFHSNSKLLNHLSYYPTWSRTSIHLRWLLQTCQPSCRQQCQRRDVKRSSPCSFFAWPSVATWVIVSLQWLILLCRLLPPRLVLMHSVRIPEAVEDEVFDNTTNRMATLTMTSSRVSCQFFHRKKKKKNTLPELWIIKRKDGYSQSVQSF